MKSTHTTGYTAPLLLVAGLLAGVGCGSVRTSYTTEAVQPPESLERALVQAEDARLESRATLPHDGVTTMPLSRDGAVLTALARNRSLGVQRLDPEIAALLPNIERGAFDPRLTSRASFGRDTRQLGGTAAFSFPAGASPEIEDEHIDGSITASQYFPTGTEVYLTGGVARNNTNFTDPEYSGRWSVGVNQALLRGRGTRVNLVSLRQAENSAARSIHELRGFVIDLVEQVEQAYWALVLAQETVRIQEYSIELAQEQVRLNESYVRVGRGTTAELLSAKAELASREADLIDGRAAVRQRNLALVRLLNPDADSQWAITFDPQDPPEVAEINLDDITSAHLAKLYRPILAQAKLDISNSELEVVRTRNGLLPRLDAFGSYGRTSLGNSQRNAFDRLDDSAYDNYELGLQFEMYPLNRSERARDRRARFRLELAETALSNLEQMIEMEVRQAAIEVDRQWQRLGATRRTVESREEELRAEQSRFRVGRSTTLDLLSIQRDLVQARVDEIVARVGYIQALTTLYAVEGTLLERRGIGAELEMEL
ncbi:MAG: TolC family protein [Candidatus Sumerlaeia bacterium]|nr:TolC family protein [Candidatus Sumerlaeia bacterium]